MNTRLLLAVGFGVLSASCGGSSGSTGDTGPIGPQGAQGATGASGAKGDPGPVGMVWRGLWNATTAYLANDAVEYAGSAYVALMPSTNSAPPSANWDLLAAVGAKGDPGAKGDTGIKGDPGDSVVGVSLNVSDPNCPFGGAKFTVGTQVSYACNGATGLKGDQGSQGAAGAVGAQGAQGPIGPQGTAGVKGDTGPTGAAGPSTLGAVLDVEFEETSGTTFADSAGLGLVATAPSGGVTGGAAGHSGHGAAFSGGALKIAGPTKLPDSPQVWVEAWVQPQPLVATNKTIASKLGSYILKQVGADLEFDVTAIAGTCAAKSISGLLTASGAWVHVAGWYDGLSVVVAINGRVAATAACTNGPIMPTPAGDLDIGGIVGAGGAVTDYFYGNIDELRVRPIAAQVYGAPGGSTQRVIRYAQWSSYDQNYGWIGSYANGNGDPSMFGGVTPQSWGDGNGAAAGMTNDAETMRTLFNKKLWVGSNAMVAADTWYYYSSTNSRHTGVLMRVTNTTGAAIPWSVSFNYTSYGGWSEYASASLNGAATWNSAGNANGATAAPQTLALSIPANKTSTLIVVSASSVPSGTRTNYLAFTNNSLTLPAGLVFADDLDTATGALW